MQLLTELRAEHDLIERVAGSLRVYAAARLAGPSVNRADGALFMRFFRLFANEFHHGREEDVLFVALERQAELPADRGPVAVMLADHRRMAAILDALEPLLVEPPEDAAEGANTRVRELALAYAESLWHHIDAENSVLFPESEARLRRHGLAELDSRAMTEAEREARATGEALVARYPPGPDADVMRGDGCVMCPAFVETCRGLEREWWNEWEWEEFEDHLPNG